MKKQHCMMGTVVATSLGAVLGIHASMFNKDDNCWGRGLFVRTIALGLDCARFLIVFLAIELKCPTFYTKKPVEPGPRLQKGGY